MQILIGLSIIPVGRALAGPEDPKQAPESRAATSNLSDTFGFRVVPIPKDAKHRVFGDAAPRLGPPGTVVYSNEIAPDIGFFLVGGGRTVMDDLTLDGGATDITYYDLTVSSAVGGDPTYDVHAELWDGDPCLPGSSILAGTAKDWVGIPANTDVVTLTNTLAAPVAAPAVVWMTVRFDSTPGATQAGWCFADVAEVGSTADVYSVDIPGFGCISNQDSTSLGGKYAGFFANVRGGDPCSSPVCGDDTCCPTENACGCPADCPAVCPDTCCTGAENECTCPADCDPACGDLCCSSTEDACSCAADCPDDCGDHCCTGSETIVSCPQDCDCDIPPGTDCFKIPVANSAINFSRIPIPGEVFGSKALPYDRVVQLFGNNADPVTLEWDRTVLANACTGAPSPIVLTKDIVLGSVKSIVVLDDSGGISFWDVEATLSQATSDSSTISINRTGADGGTFAVDLYLDAILKLTPNPQTDPEVHGRFNLSAFGIEPFHVRTVGPVSFVDAWTQVPPGLPCDANFVPGVRQNQCCERFLLTGPGIHLELLPPGCVDACVEDGCCVSGNVPTDRCDDTTFADCNACEVADGPCMPDCDDTDGDGLADWIETPRPGFASDPCHVGTDPLNPNTDGDGINQGSACDDAEELANGTDPLDPCDCGDPPDSPDCNGNGRADVCDIACGEGNTCGGKAGSDDCDGDGEPDECAVAACCTKSVTGIDSCLNTTKAECDAITPPGTFLPCEVCGTVNARTARHNGVLIVHSVGPGVECPGEVPPPRSAATCTPGAPVIDPWVSIEGDPQNPVVCHDFGFGQDQCGPISGDFFGKFSDIFDDRVCLEGVSLGSPFGDADTLVERSADPFDRCEIIPVFPVEADPVAVEITGLSLKSVDPITVTFNGGQTSEDWNLTVSLSPGDQPVGALTAIKDHCNGGTYFTEMFGVIPLFTFTKVDPPNTVLTLDARAVGCDPVLLDIDELTPAPWVHDVDPNSGIVIDPCSDFHPAVEESAPTQSCDCNGNDTRDVCDIEDGVSLDCNDDGIPDECQVPTSAGCPTGSCTVDCSADCNENCIPDECESDCNGNSVPDDCDITGGATDCDGANGNGVPDECEFDCNGNDVADSCDIARLDSDDVDQNGIPDECQVEPTAQCCVPGGACMMATSEACAENGGTPGAPGSTCICGDGCCAGTETFCNCPQDCTPACGDGCCTNPDENASNCPADCPDDCGDTFCTGAENECTCSADCNVVCGDGCCSSTEDACGCAADCPDVCGDGCCTGDETILRASCPQDCDCDIPPGSDCFKIPVANSAINFSRIPIPGEVFGSNALPYDRVVQLFGNNADPVTLEWDRTELANACTGAPSPIVLTQDIVLGSVRSIVVQDDRGGISFWNVEATLRQATSDPSTISINRTGADGGTFTVDLYLDATLKLTPNPQQTPAIYGRFDLSAFGIESFHVRTVGPVSFVDAWTQVPPGLPCDANFVPGVRQSQCCERFLLTGPGIHLELLPPGCVDACVEEGCCISGNDPTDRCDDTTFADCNACEVADGPCMPNCIDTDGDGLADWIETPRSGFSPDPCHVGTDPLNPNTDGDGTDARSACNDAEELANGTDPLDPCDCGDPPVSPDCNGNGRADGCDIACGAGNTCGGKEGSDDCDGDGEPDECDDGACCTRSVTGIDSCLNELSEAECTALDGTFVPCEECGTVNARTALHNGVLIVHSAGPGVECPGEAPAPRSAATCTPGAPVTDAWVSVENDPENPVVCHDFGFGQDQCGPIGGGFFGTLSDIFSDRVCLEGVPLGSPFGDADTLVQRSADPFDRCTIITFPSTADPVDVEITDLLLKSVDPITVTFNGGQDPEEWNVTVSLSPGGQPMGTLTATKDHCNGGTYVTDSFGVIPLFTFTKVDPPNTVLILDTRALGCDPVLLDIDPLAPAPWVHDVDPNSGIVVDACSDFHPAVEESAPTQSCDCNGNDTRDVCDIEDGVSLDCNDDGIPDECQVATSTGCPTGSCTVDCSADCNENCIPDECESDCNGNSVPDDCDIDPTDPDGNGLVSLDCDGANGNGTPDECEFDCNANGVADSCDIERGDSDDVDQNGIPDECEFTISVQCCVPGGACMMANSDDCLALGGTHGLLGSICSCGDGCCAGNETPLNCPQDCVVPPVRAPAPHDILKNRYISIDPRGATGDNPSSLHIRVTVNSTEVNGLLGSGPWWANDPVNGAGLSPAVCISVVTTTKPALEPDWSGCDVVHLTGCPIVPTTTYAIAAESGGASSTVNLLDTQARPDVKWHGDCVGFFDGLVWTPPNGSTNIDDAVAGIKTFQDPTAFNATHLSVTDVHPNLNGTGPNLNVNINDVFAIILGFQGLEFSGPDLTQCP